VGVHTPVPALGTGPPAPRTPSKATIYHAPAHTVPPCTRTRHIARPPRSALIVLNKCRERGILGPNSCARESSAWCSGRKRQMKGDPLPPRHRRSRTNTHSTRATHSRTHYANAPDRPAILLGRLRCGSGCSRTRSPGRQPRRGAEWRGKLPPPPTRATAAHWRRLMPSGGAGLRPAGKRQTARRSLPPQPTNIISSDLSPLGRALTDAT